jgi:hypothetical protein
MTTNKQPDIPRIAMKIVRKDDKVKVTIGKYSITMNPLPDTSQSYDFVTFEQFITNTAQLLYSEIVKKEQAKENIRQALLGGAEEAGEQEMISKLLEEGGKK